MNYFRIPSVVKIKGFKLANSFHKNDIVNSFNRAASSYDQACFLSREVGDRLIEHLDEIPLNPKVILDLGSGTGCSTVLLQKRFSHARIIALDIAEQALLRAQKKSSSLHKPTYMCANMEQLPLADKSVDLIYSNLALHWCIDMENTLKEINRVLCPDGLFLFSTLGLDTLRELRDSWNIADGEVHVHHFVDMHDVGDALLKQRFSDPVMEMEYLIFTYKDIKKLFADLKATGFHNIDDGRFKGLQGKDKFKRFLAEYETFRREDGYLPATFEIIYGHAKGRDLTQEVEQPSEISIPIDEILRKKQ